VGKPRKYPLDQLEVGQSYVLCWTVDNRKEQPLVYQRVKNAIKQDRRRYGRRFSIRWVGHSLEGGLQITRTA
jgi:hypothetical protein